FPQPNIPGTAAQHQSGPATVDFTLQHALFLFALHGHGDPPFGDNLSPAAVRIEVESGRARQTDGDAAARNLQPAIGLGRRREIHRDSAARSLRLHSVPGVADLDLAARVFGLHS